MRSLTDDADLMREVAEGSREAFALLVRRHSSRVHGYARALVGHSGDAEDIAQEVFIKLWRRPQSFEPARGAFTTWLFQVTRNTALTHLERVRGREEAWDDALDETPDGAPGPEEARVLGEDQARFLAAVSQLPESQRSALALVYSQGLSGRETAAILGVSQKAVESLLIRAKRRLRAFLIPDSDPQSEPDLHTSYPRS